jgi:hypothetical protein
VLNIVTTYAWTGSAFVVPSAAAKAGVLAMTRSLAVEWATYGIRSNAIAPGPFPTEGAWSALMPTPELEAEAKARIPMGRFGEHDELANLAVFLVSDGGAFINGECVTIDGGEWIGSGGEFNHLTRIPRDSVKAALRAMRRPKCTGGTAPRRSPMKAAILAIGDEIVSGLTTDTNSGFLAAELREAGGGGGGGLQRPGRRGGDPARAVERALEEAELVVCTGGLGPTADDLTTAASRGSPGGRCGWTSLRSR